MSFFEVRRPILTFVNSFPRQPTHATTVTDKHATMEELLEAVFSVRSVTHLYKENKKIFFFFFFFIIIIMAI
jgi:hypothetical protein